MSGYFEDKVAAVTGAASGLGLGITEELLKRGAEAVFMGDFNEEGLKRESERLNTLYPGKVFPVITDVTKLEQVQKLISDAKKLNANARFQNNLTYEIWQQRQLESQNRIFT